MPLATRTIPAGVRLPTDMVLEVDWAMKFLSDDSISDRIDFIYYKGENLRNSISKIVKDDPPGGFFNSITGPSYPYLTLKFRTRFPF
jgi:hypothetical protein